MLCSLSMKSYSPRLPKLRTRALIEWMVITSYTKHCENACSLFFFLKATISKSSSPWVGSDVLYLLGVIKRARTRKSVGSNYFQPPSVGNFKFDRYILILRRGHSDPPSGSAANKAPSGPSGKGKKEKNNIFLLYLLLKDGQIEVKQHFDLR